MNAKLPLLSPTLILSFFFKLKISLISTVGFFCFVWGFFLSIHVSQSLWSGISLCLSYSLLMSRPQSFQQTHISQISYSCCSHFYLINLHWICWCLPVVKKNDSALSLYLPFSKSVFPYLVHVFKYKRPTKDHDSFQVCLMQNKNFQGGKMPTSTQSIQWDAELRLQ